METREIDKDNMINSRRIVTHEESNAIEDILKYMSDICFIDDSIQKKYTKMLDDGIPLYEILVKIKRLAKKDFREVNEDLKQKYNKIRKIIRENIISLFSSLREVLSFNLDRPNHEYFTFILRYFEYIQYVDEEFLNVDLNNKENKDKFFNDIFTAMRSYDREFISDKYEMIFKQLCILYVNSLYDEKSNRTIDIILTVNSE